MQEQQETWQERHARELKETMNAVQYAWAQLKELGVEEIEIEFEGGGDEGQIEGVTTEPKVNTSCPLNLNISFKYLPIKPELPEIKIFIS